MKSVSHFIFALLILSCNVNESKDYIPADTTVEFQNDDTSADHAFLEFFSRFMMDQEFQKARTIFSFELPDKKITTTEEWQHISFFSQSSFIPILSSDTLDPFKKDSDFSVLNFSLLNFKSASKTNYQFDNLKDQWFLTGLESASINTLPDGDFIEFLIRFSKDSLFQLDHVLFPFPDIFSDPLQDFEIATTMIQKDQWEHLNFSSEIKELMLPDAVDANSKYRYISLIGNENGVNIKYTFKKIDDQWTLVKTEDYST